MLISAVSALSGADAQLREELVTYLRPTVCLTVPYAHGDAICSINRIGKGQRHYSKNSRDDKSDFTGTASGVAEEKESQGGS